MLIDGMVLCRIRSRLYKLPDETRRRQEGMSRFVPLTPMLPTGVICPDAQTFVSTRISRKSLFRIAQWREESCRDSRSISHSTRGILRHARRQATLHWLCTSRWSGEYHLQDQPCASSLIPFLFFCSSERSGGRDLDGPARRTASSLAYR